MAIIGLKLRKCYVAPAKQTLQIPTHIVRIGKNKNMREYRIEVSIPGKKADAAFYIGTGRTRTKERKKAAATAAQRLREEQVKRMERERTELKRKVAKMLLV